MGKPNYRVVVSFDPRRASWSARAPELEHLTGDGASRKDAIAKLEEEIDAQLANMLSLGSEPPKAADEIDHSGEVSAKISKSLHRELYYMAQSEGVELDQLVGELLSFALAQRQGTRAPSRKQQPGGVLSDDIGNRVEAPRHSTADGNRADGNRGGNVRRGGNPQLLDDRANFIEYVRNLDQNPPSIPQNRGGGGGFQRPNNNNSNNGGGGGEANRRRRGRGGSNQGNGAPNPQAQGGRGARPDNRGDNRNGGPRAQQVAQASPAPSAAPAPAPAATESHE
ncbi:MAG: hypothetical protein ABI321_24480 [Polyangia bacterium]